MPGEKSGTNWAAPTPHQRLMREEVIALVERSSSRGLQCLSIALEVDGDDASENDSPSERVEP